MRYLIIILCSIVLCTIVIGIFFWIDTKVHRGESTQSYNYTVPYDYDKVRKILVRTNSLEAIVQGSGDLLDRKWNELNLSTPDTGRLKILGRESIFKTWVLQGEGIFRVRLKQEHFVGEIISLKLKVWINKDQIRFDVTLAEPSQHMDKYESTTFVTRDGAGTKFSTKLCIGIHFAVPSCLIQKGRIQKGVEKSVSDNLLESQRAIEVLIAKYKDTRLLIPLTI